MTSIISQRELRNQSGEIMRALDRGENFIVTRNGIPVGELRPVRRRFVSRDLLLEVLRGTPPIDAARFREDVDARLDQDIEPSEQESGSEPMVPPPPPRQPDPDLKGYLERRNSARPASKDEGSDRHR